MNAVLHETRHSTCKQLSQFMVMGPRGRGHLSPPAHCSSALSSLPCIPCLSSGGWPWSLCTPGSWFLTQAERRGGLPGDPMCLWAPRKHFLSVLWP